MTAPDRKLYLAVGDKVYESLFEQKAIQAIVKRFQLSMIVVKVEAEEILSWIN